MNEICRFVALAAIAVLPAAPAAAEVEVADIFGPEMVLQRDSAVPVWGRAEPAENVTVAFAGQEKTAAADGNGRWSVKLDAMPASAEPRPLVVKGDGDPLTFENVRVGEVWLVLSHWIGKQFSCEGPAPNDNTRVRAFGGDKRNNHSPTPQQSIGNNRFWGPGERVSEFDLLTIPFANRLNDALGVPVGIVRVSVGELDATIPVEGFAAVPALADMAQEVETWYSTTPRGKQAFQQW